MLLADKTYNADGVRAFARSEGGWASIPPRRTRMNPICFSSFPYRARNRIDRFLNRIQRCRRIATCQVKLAAVGLCVRINESTP